MRRIGIVAATGLTLDSFFPGIRDGLQASGLQVHLAAGTPTRLLPSTTLRSLTRRPGLRNVGASRELHRWVEDQDLDLVVANTATASFLVRLALREVPVVYFAHGLHWSRTGDPRTRHWELLERAALGRTSGVIVLNREDEDWVSKRAPRLPVLRLTHGVGLSPGAYPRFPVEGRDRLVWIGEHSRRKRPETAVEVVRVLLARRPALRLRMLGEGPLTGRLAAHITRAGLAEAVELVGHVPVAPELRRASALLHTARWEGLPRVVLEAQATGRPTVAYDVKGLRGLAQVHTVTDGDVGALARRVEQVLDRRVAAGSFPTLQELSTGHAVVQLLPFLRGVWGGGRDPQGSR